MRLKFAALAFLGVPFVVQAQTPALGPEFPVNSTTALGQQRAAAAPGAAGTFVVTWQSMGQDGSGYGVIGRRFDSGGAPVAGEFPVNSFTTDSQSVPAIASDPAGAFVVAWMSYGDDGSYASVRARRFDTGGNAVGDDFRVNTYTPQSQSMPRVAANGNGFVVVWESHPGFESSEPGQDGDGSGVFAQRYDSLGAPLGGEFQVNAYTTGHQRAPAVAMDSSGGFVVAWASFNAQDPTSNVYARRYDSSGDAIGGDILVNAYTPGYQRDPDIAMNAAGEFVVVWHGYDLAGSYADILGRHFSSAGDTVSGDFTVNAYTTGQQGLARIAMEPDGRFLVTWESWFQSDEIDIFAQRFEPDGRRRGAEFPVNVYTTGSQYTPAVAVSDTGQALICWTSDFQDGEGQGVYARLSGFPEAQPMSVDTRTSGGTSNVNGVLESGERVTVDPAWRNASASALPLAGTASNFTGPVGPTYGLDDTSADYGTVGAGTSVDCYTATTDCLEVSVSGARPVMHWDAKFDETLSSGVTKTWTLHVGESFADVPMGQPFYAFIEDLFHNRITGGCGGSDYCPDGSVTRAQMAVFLLKAEHGTEFVPPACANVFPDVACPSPFADWIEQLFAEGITGGCGGGNYCPDNPVTRAQMAVFLLKAEHGSTYTPPACTGIFPDVPCSNPFAPWIEQLFAEGITGGCGGGNYCPANPNTRGQMAVFLVKTFGLELYGAD